MSTQSNAGGGIGLGGGLALLFIGLKLGRVITWSWWWVLCPLWIPLAFALLVAVIAGVVSVMKS